MSASNEQARERIVAWFATKGSATNEAKRMATLLSRLPGRWELPFDKRQKGRSAFNLVALLHRKRPDLLVMEGTGIGGGAVCLAARILWKIPYVVSSGDAVGPFVASFSSFWGVVFAIYERVICRLSAGYIGWTPYLSGRALTFGAPRAMTAAGWPLGQSRATADQDARGQWRARWGIPDETIVVGLVGSLTWNARRRYCYGLDLVRAANRLERTDLCVVIVGGGDGMEHLKAAAGQHLGHRVRLPGPVDLNEVVSCLAAFDVGALPQSVDGVGAFRYTTKLSEYAAARLPVVTSQIPMAYDLGLDWMWRLRGGGPWEETYTRALVEFLEGLERTQIDEYRARIPRQMDAFDQGTQVERVTSFVKELLDDLECCPAKLK